MDLTALQQEIASFNHRHDLDIDPRDRLLDLNSEMGELSKAYLKCSGYGAEKPEYTKEWSEELGDCFYALISLANETGVDLETVMQHVPDKYAKRLTDTGGAGSGR